MSATQVVITGAVLSSVLTQNVQGVLLPYSRVHELEADELGMLYMARAGYDPAEAVEFWQRFQAFNRKQGSGKPPEFLSTHPLDDRRIAQLRALLPRAEAEYARARKG